MHLEKIGKSVSFHLKHIALSRFDQDSAYKNIISPFSRLYLITQGNGYLVFDDVKINKVGKNKRQSFFYLKNF